LKSPESKKVRLVIYILVVAVNVFLELFPKVQRSFEAFGSFTTAWIKPIALANSYHPRRIPENGRDGLHRVDDFGLVALVSR
jgi:hypothetical protein